MSKFVKQRAKFKREIKEIRKRRIIRTIQMEIYFKCMCSQTEYMPEPIPLIRSQVSKHGFKIKSLTVWKDTYLDTTKFKSEIAEMTDNKCYVVNSNCRLSDEGFRIKVIDYYEDS